MANSENSETLFCNGFTLSGVETCKVVAGAGLTRPFYHLARRVDAWPTETLIDFWLVRRQNPLGNQEGKISQGFVGPMIAIQASV